LLANIVMAWNTHHIQAMIDASSGDHPDEVTRRLAPIGHKHINKRGIPDVRTRPSQVEPASAGAFGRFGTRARMKKLTLS
jgi:hypothetical protein